MSDTTTQAADTTATASNQTATDQATQGDPADDKPLGEKGEKALKAERDRARDLERQLNAATAKLTQIEQANETALEKAQREAQEAKEAAEKATTDALRFRIAAEAGITENVDLILTAGDEATMRRQAELWASRTTTTTAAGPRPDLTQGGSGAAAALNGDGLEMALRSKLGIT